MIVLPTRTEVFVRTEQNHSPTTQTSGVSFLSTNPQMDHKEHEVVSLDVDVERGPEK